jgi:hypothetical protein
MNGTTAPQEAEKIVAELPDRICDVKPDSFLRGGPMVRIRLPPPASQQRTVGEDTPAFRAAEILLFGAGDDPLPAREGK